jgi:CRP-like cAMP-binding protein
LNVTKPITLLFCALGVLGNFKPMEDLEYKRQLINYISERIELTEQEKEKIASYYSVRKVAKKDHLFEQGAPCVVECFVVQGTLRVYYTDLKGLEHVLNFAFPDWWVGDMASFLSGDPSSLSVQALEDTTVLVIDPERKEALLQAVPKLERFFRMIIQKHLSAFQKRFLLTISASAAERYHELIQRSPGIEQLVPQHQIASYLGILPESLSRMKKQLLKQ